MTTAPVVDLTVQARTLTDQHRHAETLALLDAADGGALPPGQAGIWRATALYGLERFRAAHELLGEILGASGLSTIDRLRAQLHAARVLRRASPLVDDALRDALGTAEAAERLGGDALEIAGEARIEAAHLFARKRCRALAERELAAAAKHALPAALHFAEGHVLSGFDERALAKAKFEAAGGRQGKLGLAHLLSLAGEFDAAHKQLDELGPLGPGDLYPRRLRLRLFLSQARWEDLAAALGEVVSLSPAADPVRSDMHERAEALFRAGKRTDALAAWQRLVDTAPPPPATDWFARLATRMLRLLNAPDAAQKPRRRLPTFPSVAQLRDHCGPATIELYLRFFGVSASQVEIARAIKFPDGGTPVYRMRRYLEGAGFTTRRVEADLPQLKRLLDAGIPVILEEDYSDSRHVAVAIGYDDEREILEVQDPMSHDVRETFYEDLIQLRAMSNDGALVGVPKDDAKLVAALDAAGAKECRYITAVDEAWAAFDDKRWADGDKLADESVGLRKDYELAWLYRFHRARATADEPGADEAVSAAKAKLHGIVDEILTLWPDDEWPQQLLGEVLCVDGRWGDALPAFQRARDRNPNDAHNWSSIADCFLAMRRYDEAYDTLAQALRRNPAHRRANENQAHMALVRNDLSTAWHLNECARELAPKNPFNHGIHASLLAKRGELGAAVAAYDRALAIDPQRIHYAVERAKLLAKDGKVDVAADSLRALVATRPKDIGLMIELADLLYANGRAQPAIAVCQEMLALDKELAAAYAILGAAQCGAGDVDTGLATMRQALQRRPTYGWVFTEMGRYLSQQGKHIDAVQAYAASLGLVGGPLKEFDLGDALGRAGFTSEAAQHLRSAVHGMSLSERQVDRVAEVVTQENGPFAAHELLLGVAKDRPRDLPLLRAHARLLLEYLWAPGLAEPVLAGLSSVAPEDPFVLAWRGADLMDRSPADEDAGEKLLRAAIATAPQSSYPRRLLAAALDARGRFAEALDVLAGCGDDYQPVLGRVSALVGLDRIAEAEAAIAKFGEKRDTPERPNAGVRVMRFKIAQRRWDWTAALDLVEQISRLYNERDDDGRLDHWEEEKFRCLCRLGQADRALAFGEKQATDASSLATLAHAALGADQPKLAAELAARALRLDADQTTAMHVVARLTELAGKPDEAIALWERMGGLSRWHIWRENVARVLLGVGDPKKALGIAETAVTDGHTCAWAWAVRAQARLLGAGDKEGAKADLEMAWRMSRPQVREHQEHDVWALRLALAGDPVAAELRWREYERENSPVSPADRARVARLKAAVK